MPAAKPIAPKRRRLPTDREDAVMNKPLDRDGNPTHHYVLVSKNTHMDMYGVGHYQNMGYSVVPLTEGGPRIAGIPEHAPPAPHQEWRGCILMAIPMDEKREIDEFGLDGAGGARLMAERDQQMSQPFKPTPDFQYVQQLNETEAPRFVKERD